MAEVKCPDCRKWLGESHGELVFVEQVDRAEDSTVPAPRDVRYCRSCRKAIVFVARRDLDGALAGAVR